MQEPVTVLFENIGPERVSFTAKMTEFTPYKVLRALRNSKVLTKLPDIMWGKDGQSGTVWMQGRAWAGRFRVVVVEEAEVA